MSDVDAKAAQAKRLIEDPVLKEAFANVRKTAIEAWARSHTSQTLEREQAFWTVRMLDLVESQLEAIASAGKIAAARVQNPLR